MTDASGGSVGDALAAGAVARGADLLPAGPPVYLGLDPADGRWLRLDTSTGSALVRGEPGLSIDHDRGGIRIRARDGSEYSAPGVDDATFGEVLRLVGAAVAS